MNRRAFLQTTGFAVAAFGTRKASAFLVPRQESSGWRFYEITTEIEVLHPRGMTQVWVPRPLIYSTPFQREAQTMWRCHEGESECSVDRDQSLSMIHASFSMGSRAYIKVSSQVGCHDWTVDMAAREKPRKRDRRELAHFLKPTLSTAHDHLVHEKAVEITARCSGDVEKARAIYEWIVTHTYRDPSTRGCGVGDADSMLRSGDLGGKCADLNGLFVALAREAGLPARNVYGIRIAPSHEGFESLGAHSSDITKAQHCRAEVYLEDHGWVPVDPADVRKALLEEKPGGLTLSSPRVEDLEARLFGSWEMNWMAYNTARDVSLPGSKEGLLPFFMYPQAETADGRVDCLDPQSFRYTITARPIAL